MDERRLYWQRRGSNLDIGIDLKSVEAEGRTVVGFATLDNIDFANDIVPLEASIKAFEDFRGNIRIQHDRNQPVGKMTGAEVAEYTDPETGETHLGVKVSAYISKGADHVWEMVQDGTLSAFSIGAAIKKATKAFDQGLRKEVRIIEEYVLLELSLVDNPMNNLANVVSVFKSLDDVEYTEKGFVGTHLMYCAVDQLATKSTTTSAPCPKCGEIMANLGHISDNTDIGSQLNKVFAAQKGHEDLSNEKNMKGGHPKVADTVEKDADNGDEVVSEVEASEVVEVETETVVDEAGTEVVETESAEVEEVELEETVAEVDTENEETSETVEAEAQDDAALSADDVRAMLEGFKEILIQEFAAASSKDIAGVVERFETVEKALNETVSELKEAQDLVNKRLDSFEGTVKETNKRLDVVDNASAMKKSLDSDSVKDSQVIEEEDAKSFKGFFSTNIKGWDC